MKFSWNESRINVFFLFTVFLRSSRVMENKFGMEKIRLDSRSFSVADCVLLEASKEALTFPSDDRNKYCHFAYIELFVWTTRLKEFPLSVINWLV